MRDGLPPAPPAIQALPLDARGYPIPWFVHVDPETGKEDFRVVGRGKLARAHKQSLCWICGRQMRRMKSFVIGPMCAINRVSSEPPSHPECAVWAARACPFLTRPLAKRNDRGLPEGYQHAAGVPILRNPGVTLVWSCLQYGPSFPEGGGVLFDIGKPARVQWFAYGRPATREEVAQSIDSGLPILQQAADDEGAAAQAELKRRYVGAMQLLPKAA